MVILVTKNSCLPLLAAICLASAAVTLAAEAPPAPVAATTSAPSAQGPEVLEELDEVVVRGRRLQEAIVEAERDFYKLYNQLNKNDDYDVNCAYLNNPDSPGSRIQMRMCIPGFVADAMVDWNVFRLQCNPPIEEFDVFSCLDRNDDNRLSQQEVSARVELDARMFTLDADRNGYLTRDELPDEGIAGTVAPYQPPSPDLVLMEGTSRWYTHMMQVIKSDPRLEEQAGKLDDLYRDLRQAQRRVGDLEAEKKANAKKATFRPRTR